MKKIIILLVIVLVGVFFASPYWTLYQLKNAYEHNNSEVINQHIDFVQVRQNLKSQLQPVLTQKVTQFTNSPILQMLHINVDGASMVDKMLTQAIDNTVTPNGVSNILTSKNNLVAMDNNAKLLGGLTAVAMGKFDIKDLIIAQLQGELNQKIKDQLQAPNPNTPNTPDADNSKPTASYCGFNCFAVNAQVQGYPITVNMERQGLIDWKIVGVKLPL